MANEEKSFGVGQNVKFGKESASIVSKSVEEGNEGNYDLQVADESADKGYRFERNVEPSKIKELSGKEQATLDQEAVEAANPERVHESTSSTPPMKAKGTGTTTKPAAKKK